jgi:hypothetical protein
MGNKKLLPGVCVVVMLLLLAGCTSDQKTSNETENDTEDTNGESSFVAFEYPPFDLEKVAYILPMGGLSGSHVTPIDHQYYVSYDFTSGDDAVVDIEVYSPGDGVVTEIQHMSEAAGDTPMPVDDFRVIIEHTSTISSYYIHIDEVSDKIAAVDPGLGEYAYVNVPVNAGEVIGRYGGSVDYNIVDESVMLSFVNPDSYVREPWKVHCPDPFDYFIDEIKSTMVEKCLRTQEPIGGTICYDVEGRLVGTWFEEGTNGYAGADPDRYWAGHLSIVYDSIDPTAVIVSIGTFIDSAKQFAVKGNSPDPAGIDVDYGLVTYELVDYEYVNDGTVWDRTSFAQGLTIQNSVDVAGVILLQLLEDNILKVEIIPGVTNDEVTGFTDNAHTYVR